MNRIASVLGVPFIFTAIILTAIVDSPLIGSAQSTSVTPRSDSSTAVPNAPGSAGPKDDRSVVQRGNQPNAEEVRPGNPSGDSPSASAGTLVTSPKGRRILGLPVGLAIVIGGVVLVLLVAVGLALPGSRRQTRARGNGTYGRRF